ncbi:MAG: hypothetical protein ACK4IK_03275 [Bacteroidia bacterium]
MDKYQLRKEIAQLIDSIKEHSDNIGNRKRIPQLELELILSKIKKLYEKSIVFNYINQHQIEEWEEHEEPIIPAAIEEIKEVVNNKPIIDETMVGETKVPEELLINIPIEEAVETKEELKKEKEEQKNELASQEKLAIEVNTKISESGRLSLNDKLSKQVSDISLLSKLRKKPIDDIVKAIGINERYLFTKELFKGNSEAFMQHVKAINSLNTYEEAQLYLEKEIIHHFSWDANNPAVSEFLDLVQRRFIK